MLGDESCAHGPDVFGLVAIETGGVNEDFQFLLRDGCVISRSTAANEEGLRYDVDSFVGALRGEDGGDKELERA